MDGRSLGSHGLGLTKHSAHIRFTLAFRNEGGSLVRATGDQTQLGDGLSGLGNRAAGLGNQDGCLINTDHFHLGFFERHVVLL